MNNLVRFLKRFHFTLLFLLLQGIALTLLVNYNRYQAGQFMRFYNEVAGFTFNVRNNLTQYFNLRRSNLELAAENAQLRRQIEQSYQIFDQNFFVVNDTVFRLQYEYIHAQIIKNTTNRRNNYLIINKGFNQGVREGMAVISPTGVVGIVRAVSSNFSSIMSLLHSHSRISARIEQNNFSTGSVSWNGRSVGISQMLEVPPHIQVHIGDTVITSGFSLNFPEGILIGTVSRVHTRPTDNFHTLDIKLSTDFHILDHVYVVRNLARDELNTLIEQRLPE
ncbi:MAG: rod shape-determining protein MreC [Bacteroidales bacterium]|nr:rod shape-determining protein MreC [Bacteroidales bacterium]